MTKNLLMRRSGLLLFFIICFLIAGFLPGCASNSSHQPVSDSLRDSIVHILENNLRAQSQWAKVHAAEYLIALGHRQDVKTVFLKEQEKHGTESPYRIGIWRVLAEAAGSNTEKNVWISRILKVYGDTSALDRVHAAETLAKLHISPVREYPKETSRILRGGDNPLSIYTRWAVVSSMDADTTSDLSGYFMDVILNSTDEDMKSLAAYAVRHLDQLDNAAWSKLAVQALAESEGSKARIYLTSAAFVTVPDDSLKSWTYSIIRKQLLSYKNSPNESEVVEMIAALAEGGDVTDLFVLTPLLAEKYLDSQTIGEPLVTPDIMDGAGYAILRIDRRIERTLTSIDWLVVTVYLLGMLGIGFYYYRRNKNQNDFFLGGGKMNAIAVGLSLFATFTSAVSYMAYPGEMIKHGPVIFIGMIAFPIAYYLVGWFIIPRLRKFKVTSAYEILEIELDRNVRMLATIFFLVLRLLWMATIIYITVHIVVLSVFKIDPVYALPISLALMVITIVYTAVGGLKAVVLTDAIQAVILLGGALVAILVVCFHFGSFTSWLPHKWLPQWGEVNWSIDARDRSSIGAAILMTLVWYVASAGADQMSVQRFLATKDVPAARKTFGVSLLASFIGLFLLGLVGLALIAYFKDNPQFLNSGNMYAHADKLFPRFMVIGLPPGVSGLLIAGVLAAAMSSLSSGLNSCASVVMEDIIKRFNPKKAESATDLRQVHILSILIGVVTLALSMLIPYVSGNLYDLALKVVNLLVSPLFVLFFMALFVPFSTARGTFFGGIVSVITAVAIAFFGLLGIDVFFITIASLIVGIIAGIIGSFIDYKIIGNKAIAAKK